MFTGTHRRQPKPKTDPALPPSTLNLLPPLSSRVHVFACVYQQDIGGFAPIVTIAHQAFSPPTSADATRSLQRESDTGCVDSSHRNTLPISHCLHPVYDTARTMRGVSRSGAELGRRHLSSSSRRAVDAPPVALDYSVHIRSLFDICHPLAHTGSGRTQQDPGTATRRKDGTQRGPHVCAHALWYICRPLRCLRFCFAAHSLALRNILLQLCTPNVKTYSAVGTLPSFRTKTASILLTITLSMLQREREEVAMLEACLAGSSK